MKISLSFSLFLLVALLFSFSAKAQKVQTIRFEVGGVCDMCKDRIESALDTKGIKIATYDLSNHMLEVTFKTSKITEDQIHQRVADVGHDTSKIKATDEAYDRVHECCKYRTHEDH